METTLERPTVRRARTRPCASAQQLPFVPEVAVAYRRETAVATSPVPPGGADEAESTARSARLPSTVKELEDFLANLD